MQELWGTIERLKLWIIGIEEVAQAKGIKNIFNKIKTENFSAFL
jgi:hypothetical protein